MSLAVCAVLLAALAALAAGAAPIPEAVFPGVELDSPLQDQYATGEALVLRGRVSDPAKADGQILFNFAPQSGGEAVRAFINLAGTEFQGYQIFLHGQAGAYDLQVFLGGPGETSLGFVGQFEGLRITAGTGVISLPRDYFAGILLDTTFPAAYTSGGEVVLAGAVSDPGHADGQVLFNFAPTAGGEEVRVFLNLRGARFDGRHVFRHDQAGAYDLQVFLGGPADPQLDSVGAFGVVVERGSGVILLPPAFFTGLLMDRPLPTELPVGRSFALQGQVGDGVRAFRIDIERGAAGGPRIIRVGVDEGRFDLPLRLLPYELGPFEFSVVLELEDGSFTPAGAFPMTGVEPPPGPRLELGLLALSLVAGGDGAVPLRNPGETRLESLRYEIEGPFELVGGPAELEPGTGGEVRLRYAGAGDEQGLLRVWSNDPLRPQWTVALHGLAGLGESSGLLHAHPDAQGRLELELALDRHDYALVLYSAAPLPGPDGRVYDFSVGGPSVAARPVTPTPPQARDRIDHLLRGRERDLARQYQAWRPTGSRKPAARLHGLGDQRSFLFPDIGGVVPQTVAATVVALNERAVAWFQDDMRADAVNLGAAQAQEIIDQFAREDYAPVIAALGEASDVDGDSRLSFLFTHLVDDVGGVAGFYVASSVLPEEAGGDGNVTDMMFISPTRRYEVYRSLLVHELQHLINFNQHVLVRRGEAEAGWLNEGLSYLAEDLVANYAVSGVNDIVTAFLKEPSAVGLEGEARLDARKRGAAYLFLRGLVDRMGEGLLLRLVGTGLADRDNVEAATGEDFADLLAFWGARLYASGLGVIEHPRLNYGFAQLRAGDVRGFPLPTDLVYAPGDAPVAGSLPPRGLAFVHVQGGEPAAVEVLTDPAGHTNAVAVPLPRAEPPRILVPADYIPGLLFDTLMPGLFTVDTTYEVAGEILGASVESLLFRFSGADTLRFFLDPDGQRFSHEFTFTPDQVGEYALEVFTGPGSGELDFAGRFGPVRVVPVAEITAVAMGEGALPREFLLGPSYPNPFNATSLVPFAVPAGADQLELAVYDVLGQRVRVLHRGPLPAGWYRLPWDGRDSQGRPAASGWYVYRLTGTGFAAARAAMLVR